ncbi:MAG: ankyrin repeat domain-containing protein [Candidatus Eisenbacteria bacterium]
MFKRSILGECLVWLALSSVILSCGGSSHEKQKVLKLLAGTWEFKGYYVPPGEEGVVVSPFVLGSSGEEKMVHYPEVLDFQADREVVARGAIGTHDGRVVKFSKLERGFDYFSLEIVSVSDDELVLKNPNDTKRACYGRSTAANDSDLTEVTSSEETAQSYKDHKKELKHDEEVGARHILIRASETDPPELIQKKRAQIESLLERLRKGEDFSTLASKHSDCPSSAKGGDLGYFPRGRTAKPFEDVAFSLKNGEVSQVVRTPFGFHIIQVYDRRQGWSSSSKEVEKSVADALLDAATKGDLASVTALLQKGASANVKDNDHGVTPLHAAASEGHEEVVRFLLENGAAVDATDNDGNTALHMASKGCDSRLGRLLLEKGARVNVKNRLKATPLHMAAACTNGETAKVLLAHHADVNAKGNGGLTPLHMAATLNEEDVAKLLISHGAIVNASDNDYGVTPLHVAAGEGRVSVAEVLLRNGADVNAKEKGRGWTPAQLARNNGWARLAAIIEGHAGPR